jgi:hypothetical protein
VDARTQKTQGWTFPLARARTGDEIQDPVSYASLRPGEACTCPTRETRPAEHDGGVWRETIEELGAELRWDETLQRWIRPTCPKHGTRRRGATP